MGQHWKLEAGGQVLEGVLVKCASAYCFCSSSRNKTVVCVPIPDNLEILWVIQAIMQTFQQEKSQLFTNEFLGSKDIFVHPFMLTPTKNELKTCAAAVQLS